MDWKKNNSKIIGLSCAILLLIGCWPNSDIKFRALNDSSIYEFENSISVKEFIRKTDSLKCNGYRIVGNSEDVNYLVFSKCKYSNQKIDYDGIQMPIYNCNGFRKYGINLCEDSTTNYNKLKEFYLNPQRREDYPTKPENAILKLVFEESMTIKSVIPTIKSVKSMRDHLQNRSLSNLPFIFSFETVQSDSMTTKFPKPID